MKLYIRPVVAIALLLSCIVTVNAAPAYHRCGITIRHATPNELILELRSTSQATSYSVDVNYAATACQPWDGHERNWTRREVLPPGLYVLPWAEFYDENPGAGAEACINWTCQPEATVIYWDQDYRAILNRLYLPLVVGGVEG